MAIRRVPELTSAPGKNAPPANRTSALPYEAADDALHFAGRAVGKPVLPQPHHSGPVDHEGGRYRPHTEPLGDAATGIPEHRQVQRAPSQVPAHVTVVLVDAHGDDAQRIAAELALQPRVLRQRTRARDAPRGPDVQDDHSPPQRVEVEPRPVQKATLDRRQRRVPGRGRVRAGGENGHQQGSIHRLAQEPHQNAQSYESARYATGCSLWTPFKEVTVGTCTMARTSRLSVRPAAALAVV